MFVTGETHANATPVDFSEIGHLFLNIPFFALAPLTFFFGGPISCVPTVNNLHCCKTNVPYKIGSETEFCIYMGL
jgi:hypothetical protein